MQIKNFAASIFESAACVLAECVSLSILEDAEIKTHIFHLRRAAGSP